MKKGAFRTLTFFIAFFLFSVVQLYAQNERSDFENNNTVVQKYTVMETFDSTLVTPVEERKRMKEERKQLIVKRRNVLDTLDISDRRRSKLLRQLNKNPFSDRINKAFADIEFEDDPDMVDQDK